MILHIPDYSLGQCYIGCYSTSEITDTSLQQDGLNAIHYRDGEVVLDNANTHYTIPAEDAYFFDTLHDFDVLEISDDGAVRVQFSEYWDDNTLFITSKCNSNCVMCPSSEYSRRAGVIPEESEIMELLRHFSPCAKHITITGGEPFLFRQSMFRVLEYCKERFCGTEFLILTNGRVFCIDDYANMLSRSISPNTVLAIPLHGSNAALHDSITQAQGSFSQTVFGITKLLHLQVPVEIRVVVSKYNFYDLIDLAKLITETMPTAYRVHFIGLEMLGNAAVNSKNVWIPYSEAFTAIKPAANMLISAGINVGIYNFPLCAVEPDYWPLCKKSISEYKRKFPAACQNCSCLHICGGVFSGSLRFAETNLHPINPVN